MARIATCVVVAARFVDEIDEQRRREGAKNKPMSEPQQKRGPAFPQSFTVITLDESGKKIAQTYADCTGLEMRDWFASNASENDIISVAHQCPPELVGVRRAWARYKFADAMIAERLRE